MMRDSRSRALPITVSLLIALGLTILPLPDLIDALRPDFLVLVVLYWAITAPQSGGLSLAFFGGLALDVTQGVVLGQHALALVLMAAWTTNICLRLRVFPLLHQTLSIFAILAGYQFILFWIDGATGNPVTSFGRWLAPLTGALIWPVLSGILSHSHDR